MVEKKHKEECNCDHEHASQTDMLELNVLDMQIRQLEQQRMIIEQQIIDQQGLVSNLEELKKAKVGKTMLFPFSKEIFVEGKLEKNDVLINVGSKTLIRKSIDEAKKIIEKQRDRMIKANEELQKEIEKTLFRIQNLEKKLSEK